MKRWQWVVLLIWIGLPLLALVSLNVISPGYMIDIFTPLAGVDGLTIFLGLEGMNLLILFVWFNFLNRNRAKTKIKNEDNHKTFSFMNALLLIFTFVFLTLPTLWIAIMYPALVRVMNSAYG